MVDLNDGKTFKWNKHKIDLSVLSATGPSVQRIVGRIITMEITVKIVKALVKEQFPQWRDLDIYPVAKSGHDNRTFHLGNKMAVRLPSSEGYVSQISKEFRWLPYLQKNLDYPISAPIALGTPTTYYPFPWSINQWIEGDTMSESSDIDKNKFARDLAGALRKLQAVDCGQGPKAGSHNCYRGGNLKVYHQETVDALEALNTCLPVKLLRRIWEDCVSTEYDEQDVWVHGDIAPGNILLQNDQFYGLIDFGVLGTGDPACDYAMAWTYFDPNSREIFLDGLSRDMVGRAKGWALWKSLITYSDSNPDSRKNAQYTITSILNDQNGLPA